MDSDNNDGFETPPRTPAEDIAETNGMGKIIFLNWVDEDNDGVMDFADGYDRNGVRGDPDDYCDGKRFVPIVFDAGPDVVTNKEVKITLEYDASDPLGVWTNGAGEYFPAPGSMRIWTKDGYEYRCGSNVLNGGSYVAPGEYTAWNFGFRSEDSTRGQVTYYVEAVHPGCQIHFTMHRAAIASLYLATNAEDNANLTLPKLAEQADNTGLGDAAAANGARLGSSVDMVNGNARQDEESIRIPCPLIDLEFQMSFNSQRRKAFRHMSREPLGHLWTHSYDWQVFDTNWVFAVHGTNGGYTYAKGMVTNFVVLQALADPNLGPYGGDYRYFARQTNGTYQIEDSLEYRLVKTNGWELALPGGLIYRFDQDGLLTNIAHAAGRSVTLSYSADAFPANKLTRVEHDNGQFLDFTYNSDGCITNIAASNDLVRMAFYYSADKTLVKTVRTVAREGGTASFTNLYSYAPNPTGTTGLYFYCLMTNWVDATGVAFDRQFTNNAGHHPCGGSNMFVRADGEPYKVGVQYPDTNRTVVTKTRGADKQRWEYSYRPDVQLVTNIAGPIMTNEIRHDGAYNVTGLVVRCAAGYTASTLQFDAFHNPTSSAFGYCAPATSVWTRGWDTNWLVCTNVVDPEGHETRFEYSNALLVNVSVVDSNASYATSFSRDGDGLLTAITNANGHWVRYGHDSRGYVTTITPQAGPAVSLARNALGYVTNVTLPGGRVYGLEVDEWGAVLRTAFPNGDAAGLEADAYGSVLSSTDTASRTNRFTYGPVAKLEAVKRMLGSSEVTEGLGYDQQRNCSAVTDVLARAVESYGLDLEDRVTSATDLEGRGMTLKWGVGGLPSSVTRYDGSSVSLTYDGQGFLAKAAYAQATNSFTYFANGLLKTAANEAGTITRAISAANRLTSEAGVAPNGTVSYTYWPAGQVSNVTSAAGTTTYVLDGADRAERIVSPQGAFAYAFNADNGLAAGLDCAGVVTGKWSHDIVDRLTAIEWKTAGGSVLKGFEYAFNKAWMITNVTYQDGQRLGLTYDDLDRLTGERLADCTNGTIYQRSFGYDLAGNRTNMADGATNLSYIFATGNNRLVSWGVNGTNNTVQWDMAGNATSITYSAGTIIDLTFNDRYQVTALATNGTLVETFAYDALGRRVFCSSRTQGGSFETNFFVYDGVHVIADVNATGGLVRTYTWGPGIDNLLAITIYTNGGGTTSVSSVFYALTDHQRTVHALVDTNGVVVESYRFDAWGRVLGVYDGSGNTVTESAIGNRILWQGREYSWKTGLYYFRARWYDPITGVLPGLVWDFSLAGVDCRHERHEAVRADIGTAGALVGAGGEPEDGGGGNRGGGGVGRYGVGLSGMRATDARAREGAEAVAALG